MKVIQLLSASENDRWGIRCNGVTIETDKVRAELFLKEAMKMVHEAHKAGAEEMRERALKCFDYSTAEYLRIKELPTEGK